MKRGLEMYIEYRNYLNFFRTILVKNVYPLFIFVQPLKRQISTHLHCAVYCRQVLCFDRSRHTY